MSAEQSSKRKAELTAKLTAQIRYSGPLPAPELFRQYDEVLPGAAERILKMAEREAAHRHEMEQMGVYGSLRQIGRGQTFALIVFLGAIVAGVVIALSGAPWPGSLLSAASAVAVAFLRLFPRSTAKSDNENDSSRPQQYYPARPPSND
jgi:uncharacterized membrane protein